MPTATEEETALGPLDLMIDTAVRCVCCGNSRKQPCVCFHPDTMQCEKCRKCHYHCRCLPHLRNWKSAA